MTEVDAGFLAGAVFEDRDDHIGHRTRQDGAAHHDGVAGGLVTQDKTDLAAYRFDVVEFQVAVFLAWRADANHRQVGIADGFGEVGSTAQSTGLDPLAQQFTQTRFNDWRFARIDQVNLFLGDVYADHFVATGRQATGTDCANVTQTKYADAHRIYLFVIEDDINHAN